jgi:hypothetical protein
MSGPDPSAEVHQRVGFAVRAEYPRRQRRYSLLCMTAYWSGRCHLRPDDFISLGLPRGELNQQMNLL